FGSAVHAQALSEPALDVDHQDPITAAACLPQQSLQYRGLARARRPEQRNVLGLHVAWHDDAGREADASALADTTLLPGRIENSGAKGPEPRFAAQRRRHRLDGGL